MMKNPRKRLRIALFLLITILLLVLLNFLPALSPKTPGMHERKGKRINVWYENHEAAAKDVFRYAERQAERLDRKLGVRQKKDIYIYDDQRVMQRQHYGWIASLLGLDWYIGDNIGSRTILLTSPANPPKVHSYDSIKYSVPHEIVHADLSSLNPHIGKWLTEGIALYLTNGEPFDKRMLRRLPSYEDTTSWNPIRFSRAGGYQTANTYIEYLDRTYGWDRVLRLARTEDYPACFGRSRKAVYEDWVRWMKRRYGR